MSSMLAGFNAEEVNPNINSLIPNGEYEAVISDAEEKDTASGTGRYTKFTFTIISGDYENRKLFSNLNLENQNDQAVAIARADLSAICRAVGVMKPQSYDDLKDIRLVIKVGTEKRKDTGELQNRIRGYRSIEEGAAKGPDEQAKAGSADKYKSPGQAGNGKPKDAPWAKK